MMLPPFLVWIIYTIYTVWISIDLILIHEIDNPASKQSNIFMGPPLNAEALVALGSFIGLSLSSCVGQGRWESGMTLAFCVLEMTLQEIMFVIMYAMPSMGLLYLPA